MSDHQDVFAELSALREQVSGLKEAHHGAEARARHYAEQVKYWRKRTETAEKRVRELEAELIVQPAQPGRVNGAIADLQTTVQGLARRVDALEARHAEHDAGLADLARIPA